MASDVRTVQSAPGIGTGLKMDAQGLQGIMATWTYGVKADSLSAMYRAAASGI